MCLKKLKILGTLIINYNQVFVITEFHCISSFFSRTLSLSVANLHDPNHDYRSSNHSSDLSSRSSTQTDDDRTLSPTLSTFSTPMMTSTTRNDVAIFPVKATMRTFDGQTIKNVCRKSDLNLHQVTNHIKLRILQNYRNNDFCVISLTVS